MKTGATDKFWSAEPVATIFQLPLRTRVRQKGTGVNRTTLRPIGPKLRLEKERRELDKVVAPLEVGVRAG